MITFDVLGLPAPQGSKATFINRHTGKPGMRDMGGRGLVAWRDALSAAAQQQAELHGCFDGPLQLLVMFRFPMPISRSKTERQIGCIWRTSTPDSSKLLRAVEDALKVGGLIHDDARIAEHLIRKVEVFNSWSGATICLSHLRTLPPLSLELPVELEPLEANLRVVEDNTQPTGSAKFDGDAVTETYLEAMRVGRRPVQAIADRFDIDRKVAQEWVALCRSLGKLSPASEPQLPEAERRALLNQFNPEPVA